MVEGISDQCCNMGLTLGLDFGYAPRRKGDLATQMSSTDYQGFLWLAEKDLGQWVLSDRKAGVWNRMYDTSIH